MSRVTKDKLDVALNAWEVALTKAKLEMSAMSVVTSSHEILIASLKTHGHTWSEADAQFRALVDAHSEAVQQAWKNCDELCREYHSLLALSNSQNG